MEIQLREAYSGVSRLYRRDIMGEDYSPPGPTFTRDDDGRRTADLKEGVAQALIDNGIAEPLDTTDDSGDTTTRVDATSDPDEFVDRQWNTVTSAIDAGRADEALDAVREAEEAREDGPRTSVLKALREREAAIAEQAAGEDA